MREHPPGRRVDHQPLLMLAALDDRAGDRRSLPAERVGDLADDAEPRVGGEQPADRAQRFRRRGRGADLLRVAEKSFRRVDRAASAFSDRLSACARKILRPRGSSGSLRTSGGVSLPHSCRRNAFPPGTLTFVQPVGPLSVKSRGDGCRDTQP